VVLYSISPHPTSLYLPIQFFTPFFPISSFSILLYPILSDLNLPYRTLPYPTLPYTALSYLPCPIRHYPTLPCTTLPDSTHSYFTLYGVYSTLSYQILPNPNLPVLVLRSSTLPYSIIRYSSLPYHILPTITTHNSLTLPKWVHLADG